jgi:hypothetical protein
MGRSSPGFTLVEAVVGMVLFSVIGYALLIAASVSHGSRRLVMGLAEQDRTLRSTTTRLLDELDRPATRAHDHGVGGRQSLRSLPPPDRRRHRRRRGRSTTEFRGPVQHTVVRPPA